MKRYFFAILAISILSSCSSLATKKSASENVSKRRFIVIEESNEVQVWEGRRIFTEIGKEGKPYFLQCPNGDLFCGGGTLTSLCKKGILYGADPFHGRALIEHGPGYPTTTTFADIGSVRTFMCVEGKE